MNKLLTILSIGIIGISFMALSAPDVLAANKIAATSAAFTNSQIQNKKVDNRVQILRDYLSKRNSPLTDSADTFVAEADKNNLDWRLVAAISGLESSFGKQIPYNSYNGWGWGVYGDNVINFTSWDHAIATISEGLRKNYIDRMKTADIYAIGRIYAASPTWAQRVTWFMGDIERYAQNWSPQTLSVSL